MPESYTGSPHGQAFDIAVNQKVYRPNAPA